MGELTCKHCNFEAKTKSGLKAHDRFKHSMPTTEEIRNAGTHIEVKDIDSVKALGRVKEPTLGDVRYDPFSKFKTEPDKYYYRALNVRPHNLRMREAQGFETIPGSEYGDLVLGKLPRHTYEDLERKERKKAKDMLSAPKQEFEQVAERAGVETFEEKPADD